MMMKKECVNDEVLRDELQQFDEWGFGRKLAHARHLQLVERGIAEKERTQDGLRDPFQDLHQDPWIGQPHTPEVYVEARFKIGQPYKKETTTTGPARALLTTKEGVR